MKRFHWSLQRLLDVTEQRERAVRAQVMALSRHMASLRYEATVCRTELSRALAEVSALEFRQRLRGHPEFCRYADWRQRRWRQLEDQVAALAIQRAEKSRLLLETRRRRQTLERLRAEARQEHVRQELRAEQKQFDESAQVRKARAMIASRVRPVPSR